MSLFGHQRDFQIINQKLNTLIILSEKLIMKQSELAAKLEEVSTQLHKAKEEIMAELDALRASDPDLSPEGVAAVQKLGNIAQALDDVIADKPEPSPEEPPVDPFPPVEPSPEEPA